MVANARRRGVELKAAAGKPEGVRPWKVRDPHSEGRMLFLTLSSLLQAVNMEYNPQTRVGETNRLHSG